MTFSTLTFGTPKFPRKREPRPIPFTSASESTLLYFVDITNENDDYSTLYMTAATGFERLDSLLVTNYEDEFGIYPELPLGFTWVHADWESSVPWSVHSSTPNPVDGAGYFGAETLADVDVRGSFVLVGYGMWSSFPGTWGTEPILGMVANPWKGDWGGSTNLNLIAPTGPIQPGMQIRFRISIQGGWGAVYFMWLDSGGNLISATEVPIGQGSEFDSDGWGHYYTEGMDGPPTGDGLNSLGSGPIAPAGTVAFCLGIPTASFGFAGRNYLDALRFEVWS